MTSRTRSTCALLAAFSLCSVEAGAQDSPRQAAVWVLGGTAIPGPARQKAPQALQDFLAELDGWEPTPALKGRQKNKLKRLGKRCARDLNASCFSRAGKAAAAPYVLVALFSGNARAGQLSLSLVDVTDGQPIAEAQGPITANTWQDDIDHVATSLAVSPGLGAPAADSAAPASDGSPVSLAGADAESTEVVADDAGNSNDSATANPSAEVATGAASDEAVANAMGSDALLAGTVATDAATASAAAVDAAKAPAGAAGSSAADSDASATGGSGSDVAAAGGSGSDVAAEGLESGAGAGSAESGSSPVDEITATGDLGVSETPSVADEAGITDEADDTNHHPIGAAEVLLDLLVPSGGAGTPTFSDGLKPNANHTATVALLIGGRYYLPFDPVKDLGVSLRIGWYRYKQGTQRDNPADPDFASFSYESTMHMIPVLLGPVYRLPVSFWLLNFHVGGGMALQWVRSTTKYIANGNEVSNTTQQDIGLGYYLGGEAGMAIGPGIAVAALRYTSSYTDLDFRGIYDGAYNEASGNTGGSSLSLGYRLEF